MRLGLNEADRFKPSSILVYLYAKKYLKTEWHDNNCNKSWNKKWNYWEWEKEVCLIKIVVKTPHCMLIGTTLLESDRTFQTEDLVLPAARFHRAFQWCSRSQNRGRGEVPDRLFASGYSGSWPALPVDPSSVFRTASSRWRPETAFITLHFLCKSAQ